jgi:hypothetical protein
MFHCNALNVLNYHNPPKLAISRGIRILSISNESEMSQLRVKISSKKSKASKLPLNGH